MNTNLIKGGGIFGNGILIGLNLEVLPVNFKLAILRYLVSTFKCQLSTDNLFMSTVN